MFYTVSKVVGTLIILYGFILLTRKKFMVNREFEGILVFFISTLKVTIEYIERGYILSFIFIIALPVCVLVIMITRGKYTLTNVNSHNVSTTLTEILKEKGKINK